MKNFLLFISLILCTSFTYHESPTYNLDATHTFVTFKVNRFMVGEVVGHFREVSGIVKYDPDHATDMVIDVTIKTGSIDTGFETRDGHLKAPVWLDTETHPEMTFKSQKVKALDDGTFQVTADLTIKGVTKEVSFPFGIVGPFEDPTKTTTIGLKGNLTINRQDFGITMDKKMVNGELFIGNDIHIDIAALAALLEKD